MPARAAARRLGVSPSLIHVWARYGVLAYDQRRPASRLWVRLDEADLARLDGRCAATTAHLPTIGGVMRTDRLSRSGVWERVRRGEYRASRVARGRCWEWRLQRSTAPKPAPAPPDVRPHGEGAAHYE